MKSLKGKQVNKISIVIVYYGGLENLVGLLKSIKNNKSKASYEIILVNNKLDEDIWPAVRKKYPKVKYIQSPGNIGYARGNNLGARHAKGKYLFIINPDIVLKPKSLDAMVEFLETHTDAAVVGPNFIDESGKLFELQGTAKLTPLRAIFSLGLLNKVFPKNPIAQEYNLANLDKRKVREVGVISGSCFMVRKNVFDEVGGFDENFFLYFEESDLCKRVKEKGWKIFMTPDAKAIHDWKPAEGGQKLKRFFEKSRFYFFKKHYGAISALVVEFFTRISKYSILLFLVILIAAFLRFWKLEDSMPFTGDFGWYYLEARNALSGKEMPLVGITSSIPILKQGVFWTYLLAVALKIGNFNPLSGGILSVSLGIVGVIGTYFLVSEFFSKSAAIFSSLLAASFPFIIFMDRKPFQTAAIFPFTIFFAWLCFHSWKRPVVKSFFFTGLVWGMLFQLELAAIILIPIFFISLWLSEAELSYRKVVAFLGGGFWGVLPFFIYDFEKGVFIQTLGFGYWAVTKVYENLLFLTFGSLGFLLFWNYFSQYKRPTFASIFTTIWVIFGLGSFFIKGNFSDAYLPFVYFPLLALGGLSLKYLSTQHGVRGWLFILVIYAVNLVNWKDGIQQEMNLGLRKQLEVTNFVVQTVGGEEFDFVYLGPNDQFEVSGANWKYLLWWQGADYVENIPKSYAIIEKPYSKLSGFSEFKDFGQVLVAKKDEN